jgi:hypothetical protein
MDGRADRKTRGWMDNTYQATGVPAIGVPAKPAPARDRVLVGRCASGVVDIQREVIQKLRKGPRMGRHSRFPGLVIIETSRMHLVLFGMQNRTLGPYLAAIDRILISVMQGFYFGGFLLQASVSEHKG